MQGFEAEGVGTAHAVIVIAATPLAGESAADAAALAGGHVVATVGWDDYRAALAAFPSAALIVVEAAGDDKGPDGDDAARQAALADLSAAAQAIAARLVVSFAREQLDSVGGVLLESGATLLCDPTFVDRIAASVVGTASARRDALDPSREAERLARLNAEVARIAETLARLVRRDEDAAAPANPFTGDRADTPGPAPDLQRPVDPADLRRTIRARRLRDDVFGIAGLFEDPAWDMLLDLYAAELEQRSVSISSLCIAAAVAPTTALRWISRMLESGLFMRRPDLLDRRRAYIALTERASAAMASYVAAARRAGAAIA